ncbi:hypothetical protein PUNSTDRAFT_42604 [Punctularia strigosozonata HHB-11173 SS5]|uniref:uncharacterized protein n=1 Tax=Punctularia strigosozonata (strain HHB-11173) TaxID=741275 RepID=UPI00044182A0|nr:uncharacterized protein PUNSTDRAFT_42604 [Punctularia strigosozonata HHB-11173 SS5]EIN11297.1 hypothetical protein PUNSTDRAFT_42604 [Punctularia strigosozonata HHB-11173 SS5]
MSLLHGLQRVPCAAASNNKCAKDGAQCRLVLYCSKACQLAHWHKGHQDVCKSRLRKENWTPQWIAQKREPAFVAQAHHQGTHAAFGTLQHHIWGNVMAMDCLRAEANEGEIRNRDLTLGFVASGDLRHLIRTVNALPSDYSGSCTVLMNDHDPVVTSRNLMALLFLAGHLAGDFERDIELVFHLLYSAAVTPDHASSVSFIVQRIFTQAMPNLEGMKNYSCRYDADNDGGTVQATFSVHVFAYLIGMGASTFPWSKAREAMLGVVQAPERLDFKERHLSWLSPAHRLAFVRYWSTGIVLPFGADLSAYTEPNRFMFSRNAEWLTRDAECPLYGWDARDCVATGREHGCTPEDIFGCFYFHVKNELAEFARRLRRFKLDVRITSSDALALADVIKARSDPFLAPFWPPRFDRVETSNVSDYVGIRRMLEGWGSLLNPADPHAAMLMYSMNWRAPGQADLEDDVLDGPIMKRSRERRYLNSDVFTNRGWEYWPPSSAAFRFLETINAFYDDDGDFQRYLASNGFHAVARRLGIRMRDVNKIVPKRVGFGFDAASKQLPPFSSEDMYLLG